MNSKFIKGGQYAWFHDEGHPAGYFHTYDNLQVAGFHDAPRKVHIFLPREYESSERRYPVVYVNDGNTAFFPGGLANKSWYIAETLSNLYKQNEILDAIFVAIYPVNRDREYTHASVVGRDCCGVEMYTNYVADNVKSFIDTNYRTQAGSAFSMILGSSHGGLAAFYMANRRPDAFGFVGALSPSFWVGLDSASYFRLIFPSRRLLRDSQLLEATKTTLADPQRRPTIYIDWGLIRSGGFHNAVIEKRVTMRGKEMVQLLERNFGYTLNKNLFLCEDSIGDHTEMSWARRLPNALKMFLGRR